MAFTPPGYGAAPVGKLPPAGSVIVPVPAAAPVTVTAVTPAATLPSASGTPVLLTAKELLIAPVPPGVKKRWEHVSVGHEKAIQQIERRQIGIEQSILTPWNNFNDAGMNGLEWHTMLVIGARPGQGKTLFASQIVNNAHRLNPGQKFLVLELQFEMLSKNSAMREISSHLGVSMKHLNSAEREPTTRLLKVLSGPELQRAKQYVETQRERLHFVVEKALTADEIGRTVEDFYKMYRLPFIVTLDHSMLVKRAANEKDKIEMLQNLGAVVTDVKRRYPIIFIMLSQLNRTIEDYTRQEKPGTHGNYPNEGDLFGSDALMQHADIVSLINRPAKYHLKVYGPERFSVIDPYMLAAHFVKVRSGNPRISFFKGEFEKMNILEMLPPPIAPR